MRSPLRRTTLVSTAALIGTGLILATSSCSVSTAHSGFVGAWGQEAPEQPSLVITEDKSFSGTDGCNRLVGGYSVDGDTLTFEQTASTRMACTGVDTWLEHLATAKIVGDSLEVSDAAGSVIGTLPKQ